MIASLKTFLTDRWASWGPWHVLQLSSESSSAATITSDWWGHCFSFWADGSLLLPILQPMSGTPPAPGYTHPSCHLYLIYTFTLHHTPHVAAPTTPPFIALTLASENTGQFFLVAYVVDCVQPLPLLHATHKNVTAVWPLASKDNNMVVNAFSCWRSEASPDSDYLSLSRYLIFFFRFR